MVIEIVGTGSHNAGAELMTYAIQQWAAKFSGRVSCAANPSSASFEERSVAGLRTTFEPSWYSRSGIAARLFSRAFLSDYGIVPAREVDAVLDAAGFAYGDKWGLKPIRRLAESATRWKGMGRRVVLLPQSFGPFETPGIADLMKRSAEQIDLIFARDSTSMVALNALDLQTMVLSAPDFTVGLRGLVPTDCMVHSDVAIIVPNQRMIDKGGESSGSTYVEFLVAATNVLQSRGLEVFALAHSSGDEQVIDNWRARVNHKISVVRESHPLVLKGILGRPKVIVGSRYHAIVSAMLQGVPCVGTGWSHKYVHLFEDFHVRDLLLSVDTEIPAIETVIDMALDTDGVHGVRDRLRAGAAQYERDTLGMWQQVQRILGLE